jgi:hypothetical protein
MAADETPCSSGVLRGSFDDAGSAARATADANKKGTRAGMILIEPTDELIEER